MPPDLWSLYPLMLRSRLVEEAVARLWHDGLISGEMHLGTGEEAVVAGVVSHLRHGGPAHARRPRGPDPPRAARRRARPLRRHGRAHAPLFPGAPRRRVGNRRGLGARRRGI